MEESGTGTQVPLSVVAGVPAVKPLAPCNPERDSGKVPDGWSGGKSGEVPNRQPLWYALVLPDLSRCSARHQEAMLQELAGLMENVSSRISLYPQALVCEVRSSLKYFGGMEAIHEKLKTLVSPVLEQRQVPSRLLYAASPTVTASLLLARAGHNAPVYHRDDLRSALGQLPADILRLDRGQKRRMYNMGIRTVRDLWRLPHDGLRKRFGSDVVTLLQQALGMVPEPIRDYIAPPTYSCAYDLPCELDDLDCLLPVVDEMLVQLCHFLQRRDLSISHLLLVLLHRHRAGTEIDIALRQSSRSHDHLLLLLQIRLARLVIPSVVVGVRLKVDRFDAFVGRTIPLPIEGSTGGRDRSSLDQFMEQLHARCGRGSVKSVRAVAEHCPEHACEERDYQQPVHHQRMAPEVVVPNPRPLWLLTEPVPLTLRNSRIYYRQPVRIVSGPERIEARWWHGADIRRDYYVAWEHNASRLWIFRECGGRRNWYLHGLFA